MGKEHRREPRRDQLNSKKVGSARKFCILIVRSRNGKPVGYKSLQKVFSTLKITKKTQQLLELFLMVKWLLIQTKGELQCFTANSERGFRTTTRTFIGRSLHAESGYSSVSWTKSLFERGFSNFRTIWSSWIRRYAQQGERTSKGEPYTLTIFAVWIA